MGSRVVDVCVVGGGIVGLASAKALARSGASVRVLEAQSEVGRAQSGRNSGVIHAGIYYKQGSERARLCVAGARLMYDFCAEQRIATHRCGKLIVATEEEELTRLQALMERGTQNGVQGLEMIDGKQIKQIEPHITGIRAIWSPNTGVVNYAEVCRKLAAELHVEKNFDAAKFERLEGGDIRITSSCGSRSIVTRHVVNCAGLYADRIAVALGGSKYPLLLPVRGQFYRMKDSSRIRNTMIYPVNNPRLPFLGIHFTKSIDGVVELGPSALLAFSRDDTWNVAEFLWSLQSPALYRLSLKHAMWGLSEIGRAVSKTKFLDAVRRFMPDISPEEVEKGRNGVRALAVTADGSVIEDFVIERLEQGKSKVVNVRNAPSPAATSAFAIANEVENVCKKFF